jgi:hypothetical protein
MERADNVCGASNGEQAGTGVQREHPTGTQKERRAIHDERSDHAAPIRPRSLLPPGNQKNISAVEGVHSTAAWSNSSSAMPVD